MVRWAIGVGLSFFLLACGGDDDDGGSNAGTGGTGSGGVAGSGAGGTAGTASGGTGATGTGGVGAGPGPTSLPSPTGTCPEIVNGKVTFAPAGIPPRDVQISISDAAANLDGPLIFYWHGTGSNPTVEAPYGIGGAQMDAILALGGIVAAPFHDPAAGTFPWYLTSGGGKEDDLLVADEILACAIQKVGVDTTHIHSMGMSAGGLMTTQMGYRRSAYLASIVTYSGGLFGAPPNQDPSNLFPAMIFHGGATDEVVGVSFQQISEALQVDLSGKGHFAFLCDHGGGHSIPTDAEPSVWQFLSAHPYGTDPSPYVGGLPAGFPSYCQL